VARVLITGGYGFIGSHIKESFVNAGWEVLTLGLDPRNDIVHDLSKGVPNLPELQLDAIVHAAGLAHKIPPGLDGMQSFINVNYHGTEHLLKALEIYEQEQVPIIYLSSIAVYGQVAGRFIGESQKTDPKGAFAQSKAEAENLLLRWQEHKGANVLILRLPPVAGREARGIFGDMIDKMKNGSFLSIGNDDVRRSYVLATDIAQHLPQWTRHSGIFNLTDGMHPSYGDIKTALKSGNKQLRVRTMPYWLARILSGAGDLIPGSPLNSISFYKNTNELTFDDQKARKLLGWESNSVLEFLKNA
jgi:nucleoside-diphosphate-sugar epimerase